MANWDRRILFRGWVIQVQLRLPGPYNYNRWIVLPRDRKQRKDGREEHPLLASPIHLKVIPSWGPTPRPGGYLAAGNNMVQG